MSKLRSRTDTVNKCFVEPNGLCKIKFEPENCSFLVTRSIMISLISKKRLVLYGILVMWNEANCLRIKRDLNMTLDLPQFAVVQDPAEEALQYVENIRTAATCDGGTGSILNVLFDNSAWRPQAMAAVRLSNMLTKNSQLHNGTIGNVDDLLLFGMTRTTIELEALAFGCAIAFEPFVYRNMSKFCAYSFQTGNGTFKSHDISVEYDYFPSEWYLGAKQKYQNLTETKVSNVTQKLSGYDANGTKFHENPVNFLERRMEYENGFWTRPYFDCGGGNIWMITFNSPIMAVTNGSWNFAGVATVDVALNILDIDQCDPDPEKNNLALNVFQRTHHCKSTTKCRVRNGFGFRRGTYYCFCRDGYYFPDLTALVPAYSGFDVENAFADWTQLGSQDYLKNFDCLPCPEGCRTCVDATPCMATYNWVLRSVLLAIAGLIFLFVLVIMVIVLKYRKHPVIRSSNIVLLSIMCCGGLLAPVKEMMLFSMPDTVPCTCNIWFEHVAFALIYGPLILKNWRIAKAHAGRKVRKVFINNKNLFTRLALLVEPVVFYLAVWTAISLPQVQMVKTKQELKFYICQEDWIGYGILIAEGVYLLWGVSICYKITKAQSPFNESKMISFAVYIAAVLRNGLVILRVCMIGSIGPDILYLLYVLELQFTVTSTFAIFFGHKIRLLRTVVVSSLDTDLAETSSGWKSDLNSRQTGFLSKLERHTAPPVTSE